MSHKTGTVTMAPQVLITIARFAATSVPGVIRVSSHRPLSVERLLKRTAIEDGIAVSVEEGSASIDLYLVYERTVPMIETSRKVQAEVARAIQETVGMPIREINVHIEDVDSGPAPTLP